LLFNALNACISTYLCSSSWSVPIPPRNCNTYCKIGKKAHAAAVFIRWQLLVKSTLKCEHQTFQMIMSCEPKLNSGQLLRANNSKTVQLCQNSPRKGTLLACPLLDRMWIQSAINISPVLYCSQNRKYSKLTCLQCFEWSVHLTEKFQNIFSFNSIYEHND